MVFLIYLAAFIAFISGFVVDDGLGTIGVLIAVFALLTAADIIWHKKVEQLDDMEKHVSKMTEVVNNHSKFLELQRELNNNVVAFMKAVSKTEDDSK